MEAKEAAKVRQERIEELKEEMDKNFQNKDEQIKEAVRRKDTEGIWKIWCKAVEEPYIKALDLEEKDAKKMRGRGEIKMVQRTQLPRGNEDKHIRNEHSYKARGSLKQARRCEQIVYRIRCTAGVGEHQFPDQEKEILKATGGLQPRVKGKQRDKNSTRPRSSC